MSSFHSRLSSGTSTPRRSTKLEIKLDSDFIIFRGGPAESGPSTLKGTVVLTAGETIHTKGLRVQLKGKRRTTHYWATEVERRRNLAPIINQGDFLKRQFELFGENGAKLRTIPPGVYDYDFEIELPGNSLESVEGLANNYITYNVKVIAERGVLAKDLVAHKHVRVIRTLSEDQDDISYAQDIGGAWVEKIKYNLTPRSRFAVFGSSVIADMELTPLLEKLRIGKIAIILKETTRIKTVPGPEHAPIGGMWTDVTEVARHEMDVPPDCEDIDVDTQLPMFKFATALPLPKSLAKCRQDVERNEWVKISHHLYYEVALHNPDGHISQLRMNCPIRLIISPNIPFDEDNNLNESDPRLQAGMTDIDDMSAAPPVYATHRLDRLYGDIDTSGFMTPAPASGAQTPRHFSRDHSHESLYALHNSHQVPHALTLHNRLENLQEGFETRTFAEHGDQDHSAETSDPASINHSRRSSGYFPAPDPNHGVGIGIGIATPDGTSEAQHMEYDMQRMERVPTYNTALRTPARTPATETPPSYDWTTSHASSSRS